MSETIKKASYSYFFYSTSLKIPYIELNLKNIYC